jgi:RNA polymerase sigma factor (TIGR02999 family)
MSHPIEPDVTALLRQWGGGDAKALEQLMPLVYGELRRLAASYLREERPGHTLQPTALVHEAYIRLAGQREVAWQNRAHFFGIAAQMMRRILVDHARKRQAAKRDAAAWKVETGAGAELGDRDPELLSLDAALTELESLDPRQARIVEMRFFGGLTVEETAEVTGVSPATVKREWQTARAWLAREIRPPGA